jgi:hypothetical protein
MDGRVLRTGDTAVGADKNGVRGEASEAAIRGWGGARQGFDRSGQVEAVLWPVGGCNKRGGGTGEALLRGDWNNWHWMAVGKS